LVVVLALGLELVTVPVMELVTVPVMGPVPDLLQGQHSQQQTV
jgi:hypothetical protein